MLIVSGRQSDIENSVVKEGMAQTRDTGSLGEVPEARPDVIIHQRTGYALKQAGSYPAWPWVARAGDGRLVCVFREGLRHNHNPPPHLPEQVLFTDSEDGGRTWTPARQVAGAADEFCRNAAITGLADGTLMIVYGSFSPRSEVSAAKVILSRDGGQTWDKPVAIAENCGTRAAPIVLSSGDLLVPMYGPFRESTVEGQESTPGNLLAARSADSGRTWEMHHVPNPDSLPEDEWDVCEVEKGRIVGITHFRQQSEACYFKTESRDGGRTWDVPVRTNVVQADPAAWPGRNGGPPQIDMHGQTPVLTYPDHRLLSVSMATTHDSEMRVWDVDRQLNCYRYPEEVSDSGYPCSVAVGERQRFVVDYEIRAGNSVDGCWIAGYYVDLPDNWGRDS